MNENKPLTIIDLKNVLKDISASAVIEEIKIDNMSSLKIKNLAGGGITDVWLYNNQKQYQISHIEAVEINSIDNPKYSEMFEQILSTFKFTDQDKTIISTNPISPNGSFIVEKKTNADQIIISIKNKNGEVLTADLIAKNYENIWLNMEKLGLKGKGQAGYNFSGWTSNSKFIVKINLASGDEFEVEVDASTGLIDASTFKGI